MLSMLRRMELNPSKYSYRTYVVSSGDSFSAAKAVEFEKSLHGDTDAAFRLQDAPLQSSLSLMSGSVPFMDSPPLIEGPSMNSAPPSMPPPLMGSPPPLMNSPPPLMGPQPLMGAPAPMQEIPKESYSIVTVPRARRVHQPFWTAPHSTLECLWACIRVLCGRYPDQKPLPLSFSVYPDLILTNGPATGFCMIIAAKVIRFCCLLANKKKNGEKPSVEDVRLRTIFVESWARVTTLSLSGKLLLPFVDRFLVQWPALQGKGAFWGVKKTEYVGALVD